MNLLRSTLAACLIAGALFTAAPAEQAGFDRSDLDTSVSPCVDFFQYANGGWLKKNPIPADQPRWGTFNQLRDRNQAILREILEGLARERGRPGSIEQKLGDFYASGMNTAAIEAAGLKPIQPLLDEIGQVQSVGDLQAVATKLQEVGVDAYFNFYAQQDYKDSRRVIGGLVQGGLGMPDRDYYLRTDETSVKQRREYLEHVTRMLGLLGDPEASAHAQQILELETRMAEASYPKTKIRQPSETYHPKDLAGLKQMTPSWNWAAYFQGMGKPGLRNVNVETPEFFQSLDQLFHEVPLEQHKTYLRWQLVSAYAPYLGEAFEREDFKFNGQVLSGTPEQQPRWKRVVTTTDRALGEALGQKYVEKTFSPKAKAKVQELVENLRAALREDIQGLAWMSPQTKEAALAKLNAFRYKIGYPETWIDYGTLTIDRGPYASNVMRSKRFYNKLDLDKIGRPVDPDFWYMTPPTVNAYYDPSNNEIVFPAGILQPPFFHEDAPDALNYGGIGMVIGHEITHGFDDQGAQFDGRGNLSNWWTEQDLKRFQALSKKVADEYSTYEVEGGLKINGQLVVGEAIADIGGLKLAYHALQKALESKSRAPVDGFTPEQLFFLGYARIWAMGMRPEYARYMVINDPHPHPKWRVNGPLSSMPEFHQAFKCKPGEPMMRDEKTRTSVW